MLTLDDWAAAGSTADKRVKHVEQAMPVRKRMPVVLLEL
ncbi:hypothetical protein P608_05750 [Comamonas thiooxydans]|uniref:Uncharacterized protein n=1 Tax=Comamonas thiooxydans TaxID=363952 RepID=A0A0E3CHJ2_9BURK|nr:hypothetical protein P608_05750 [Comamonas thiooxydans]KGH25435.1 hypothetical protein P606_06055 [Comamonas thiooxydans]KGH27004.1 hypothetical protein P607_04575 [Comamonas thiooxydans]